MTILRAKPKEVREHNKTIHNPIHQGCLGMCLWGYSNVKHPMNGQSGGMGRPAEKKSRGWRKGWYKQGKTLICPPGSFRYMAAASTREKK